MGKNNKPVSDNVLLERARPFKTRGEFAKKDRSAYQIAYKRGILDKVCSHMYSVNIKGENHPKYKHTNEDLTKKALECQTKKEFRKKYPSEYIIASNRGIFEDITNHMTISNTKGEKHYNSKYTNKEIKMLASKCKTFSEFVEKNYDAYLISRKRGLFDTITTHMPKQKGENHPLSNYTDSFIIKSGSKYKIQGEFLKKEPNLYKLAWKRKLLSKIIFSHGAYVNSSCGEIELFNIIKAIYPNTKKLKDRKVKIEGKPHIKGFELDIYVPELNLGIEFDGTYYHSYEKMRKDKGKKLWSNEDLKNYHQIKDQYFLDAFGINILHIQEQDWEYNKQACIDKCLEFLGINKKVA